MKKLLLPVFLAHARCNECLSQSWNLDYIRTGLQEAFLAWCQGRKSSEEIKDQKKKS